jgi:1,4-alpha-glucan branching enzyme
MTLWPTVFRFSTRLCPAARNVSVIGTFNQWDPAAHQLRRAANGDWTITVYLPTGRVVYAFMVDGLAWLDPVDDDRVPNGWGSEYSVRYIGAQIGL